jgi:hypothetical protein
MLAGAAPDASVLCNVLAERKALLRYGKRPLPGIHDEPCPTSLLSEEHGLEIFMGSYDW